MYDELNTATGYWSVQRWESLASDFVLLAMMLERLSFSYHSGKVRIDQQVEWRTNKV